MRLLLFAISILISLGGDLRAESSKSRLTQLLKANLLDDAVKLCRQVEMLAQYDKDTAFSCAWAYFRSDMNPSAERILDRFRKQSNLPEYQLLSAQDYVTRKQYDKAKIILDQVRRENPGKPVALQADLITAELYEKKDPKGGLLAAGFIYRQLERSAIDKGRISWGLGRYYAASGDARRAVLYLEATAKAWPRHADSRKQLGALYLNQSGAEAAQYAAKWLSEAYKLNKADSTVLEQLGLLYEKRGLKSDAIKKWQAALDINKDSAIAKEKLAHYFAEVLDDLIAAKKYDAALKKIESAPKAVTTDVKYSLRRGLIYRNLNQSEKAVAELQTYVGTYPKDALALRELGICYANLGLIEQSITFFSKAATEAPEDGINYAWLAWSLESKGEWKNARDIWRKAIEFLKDPRELEKATRKLATIEKKIKERDADKH